MKSYQFIVGATVLVTLVCAGMFFYAQWELNRFKETLPKVSTVPTTPKTTAYQQHTSQEAIHPITPWEISETGPAGDIQSVSVAETTQSGTANEAQDLFFKNYPEKTETGEAESLKPASEFPYNIEEVKAGFDDYNAYLAVNPEYAYQRLDDAFREQYGDSTDVDILIETIRRGNNGTGTIDDAIASAEALLRLMPGISLPEGIQAVADHLESLKETKQLALESRTKIPFSYTNHFDSDN